MLLKWKKVKSTDLEKTSGGSQQPLSGEEAGKPYGSLKTNVPKNVRGGSGSGGGGC